MTTPLLTAEFLKNFTLQKKLDALSAQLEGSGHGIEDNLTDIILSQLTVLNFGTEELFLEPGVRSKLLDSLQRLIGDKPAIAIHVVNRVAAAVNDKYAAICSLKPLHNLLLPHQLALLAGTAGSVKTRLALAGFILDSQAMDFTHNSHRFALDEADTLCSEGFGKPEDSARLALRIIERINRDMSDGLVEEDGTPPEEFSGHYSRAIDCWKKNAARLDGRALLEHIEAIAASPNLMQTPQLSLALQLQLAQGNSLDLRTT